MARVAQQSVGLEKGTHPLHTAPLPPKATVSEVPANAHGLVDQEALRRLLVQHAGAPRRIGTFSAASNVTGIKEDVEGITALLHQHGALSFWDYAAAGPHGKSAWWQGKGSGTTAS